jgi:hypothetical protein
LEALRRLGKTLIADYDDLIFGDEGSAAASSVVKNGVLSLEAAVRAFSSNLSALLQFDKVSASTHPLSEIVRNHNSRCDARVFANSIPASVLSRVENTGVHLARRNRKDIGYFSGTRSHDLDFRLVADAIFDILEQDEEVHFRVIGPLAVEDRLKEHPRAHFAPAVSYWSLPHVMSVCSCVIAPLEDTLFNSCKSRVKYLEASLSGCRLVASPIDDMRRVSAPNLALATKQSEWAELIVACINEEWSAEDASSAFSKVRTDYSSQSLIADYEAFLLGH